MMKRTLICLFTLTVLSAWGSEADFASHDLQQRGNELGKTGDMVIDPSACQNTIAMSPVYAGQNGVASNLSPEYCVTLCEVNQGAGGICLNNHQVQEHCGSSRDFSLLSLPPRRSCSLFRYQGTESLICACQDSPQPGPITSLPNT